MPSTTQDLTRTNRRISALEAEEVRLDARTDALEASSASVEGTYTTWTIQAIYDTDVNWSGDTLGIRDNGQVMFWDTSPGVSACYIISPAGGLLATLDGTIEPVIGTYIRASSLVDRYVLYRAWTDANLTHIGVQEGLAKLWERAVDLDKGAYTLDANPLMGLAACISPSGEWIAVAVKEAATGNALIFIYRGS